MKAIKKILFPTDFSETANNAFEYALAFANNNEAELKVLNVIFPEYETLDLPVMAAQATKQKVEQAEEQLKDFIKIAYTLFDKKVENIRINGIKPDVEIGSPASTITEIARLDEVDLIIMGTKGVSNLFEKVFGSVASSVLSKAPCHVMVVPTDFPMTIENVAYATDLSGSAPFHAVQAAEMLSPFRAKFHCVHVEKEDHKTTVQMEEVKTFFDHTPMEERVFYHTIKGDSVSETMNMFIKENKADMLVMSSPHRNFFERLFHDSYTQKMAMYAQVPLLVLKEAT